MAELGLWLEHPCLSPRSASAVCTARSEERRWDPGPRWAEPGRLKEREGWRGVQEAERENWRVRGVSAGLVCVCVPHPVLRSREGRSHFGRPAAGQALEAGTSLPADPRGLRPLHLCPAAGLRPPGTQGAAGRGARDPHHPLAHLKTSSAPAVLLGFGFFFAYCYIMIPVVASPLSLFFTSCSSLILDGLLSPVCLHALIKEGEAGASRSAGCPRWGGCVAWDPLLGPDLSPERGMWS